jgi:hypothetical protein
VTNNRDAAGLLDSITNCSINAALLLAPIYTKLGPRLCRERNANAITVGANCGMLF